ncbi:MAG: hypothetical protein O7G85_07195 [Planctomycetota bacterium]|nr:hypothetical protein [Planctomycetota bacterium]
MNRFNSDSRLPIAFVLNMLAFALILTLGTNGFASQTTKASEATLLAKTYEAHGGLELFQAQGTMSYTMKGFPLSGPMSKQNHSTINLKTRQNRIDGEGFVVAWDGKQAWATPSLEAVGLPARFVTLGSFYFIGMPFVFGDPGVVLTDEGYGTFNGKNYRVIRAGYESGIGHTDEDDYKLYIDPDTNRLALFHHSVTENADIDRVTWTIDELQDVDGLLVPAKMTFYVGWNPENPGDGASFTIEDVKFSKSTPKKSLYKAPTDAEIAD